MSVEDYRKPYDLLTANRKGKVVPFLPFSKLRGTISNAPHTSMPRQISSLSLSGTREFTAAAKRKATELGVSYTIAVVDAGDGLVSHVRMVGEWLGSIDIAIQKTRAGSAFDSATEDLEKMAQSGKASSKSVFRQSL